MYFHVFVLFMLVVCARYRYLISGAQGLTKSIISLSPASRYHLLIHSFFIIVYHLQT